MPQLPARYRFASIVLVAWLCGPGYGVAAEYVSGKVWPEPKVIDPGCAAKGPSDAIVLFDGKDLSQWVGGEKWIVKDGVATPHDGGIASKKSFGSCQIHLEFATPAKVEGHGQGRGNSGVYLMNTYELQILDLLGEAAGVFGPPAEAAAAPSVSRQSGSIPQHLDSGVVVL